jgi:LysR family glycine cleavage system transcriptional activator
MKNYRKSLPPLDSLLFFHAAARNKSLTLAANELFVTQAAVSKRLQRLETWLGTPLFSRAGRNLELTEAGVLLASDVEMALEFLDQAISKAKVPGHSAVRIAASSALSMFWLYDRLKAFSLSDAACEVNVITTDSTTELLSEAHDLAIVYCDGALPGWDCVSIVDVEMVPAGAPDVAEWASRCRMFSIEEPVGEPPPLLGYSSLTPDWINWENWLNDLGLAKFQSRQTLHCNSYVQSIGKALEGRGVALVNAVVMKDELTSGKLVRIGSKSLRPQKSYHLCRRKNANPSQDIAELFAFLNT